MGNVNTHSIDNILKSDKFNQLRKNMLDGRRSKECSRCYSYEDAGLRSSRQYHNTKWPQDAFNFSPDGSIKEFAPVYFDIRLNNICNLKCRMCSGYFSSAIAQEESKLFNNQKYLDSVIDSVQKSQTLDEIIKYLPYAEKIYFAGGEPLLAPEHYKILNSLIDCGNTNLEIYYNTNFTSLTYKDISVVDLWAKFSNVTVGASLDAIGAVAEYVRHGTKWQIIESNLLFLKTHSPHVKFNVTSTVGLLNVESLIELQKIWHTNGKVDISKFSLSIMSSPDHLSLRVLPAHHKSRIEDKIKAHIKWCKEYQASILAKQWQDVLNYMWGADSTHLLSKFKQLTRSMDRYRNESFGSVLPEFSDLV